MKIRLRNSIVLANIERLEDKVYLLPALMYEPSFRCINIHFLNINLYASIRNRKKFESIEVVFNDLK